MRDTVHIRREGFGNDRYSHAHNVNHEMPQQDMTQLCVEELWATFCGSLTCGFFTSGHLERFPVRGVSAHSPGFPAHVFPRATFTPNPCEDPVTGNRPDGSLAGRPDRPAGWRRRGRGG